MKQYLKNKTIVVLATVIVLMIAMMVGAILFLNNYVNTTVHNERVTYLTNQADTTAKLVNKILGQYVSYSEICANIIDEEIEDGMRVDDFVAYLNENVNLDDVRLTLVDKDCTWYGEDATSGKITKLECFSDDTPDFMMYITTGVDVSIESICFRSRLNNDKVIITDRGTTQIEYCNIIYYMDRFQKTLKESFSFDCNSFVIDEEGLMLYKNFDLGLLMNGSNIFSKYERAEFFNGDNGEDQLKSIKNRETTAGEMRINGESYYITTAPLSFGNWYLSFVVEEGELTAGSYVKTINAYIMIIAGVFAVAVALAGFTLLRILDSKKRLDMEKEANKMLASASQAKSDFVSNMSHDIRTPINGIMGMTALAKAENNNPKTGECLEKIDVSAKYLLSLVNNVLDISSIESGKLVLSPQCADLREVLENCISIIKPQSDEKHLVLEQSYKDLPADKLLIDKSRFSQVIVNILGNAVKFTPEGGRISLRCETALNTETAAAFRIEIEDNGEGMEPEFLKIIWSRFSQGRAGARSRYKGTGLGMAISKQLINAMGGEIFVRSKPGEGSCFTIEITFNKTENSEEVNLSAAQKDITNARILVAEDNEINMEIICELLKDRGAYVEEAVNGLEAVEKVKSVPEFYFDIVLMDIMMPEMNGLEATKAIRALPRSDAKALPIVAMTANVLEDDVKAARNAGMNDYVSKPIDIDTLTEIIAGFYHKEEA